MSRTLALALLAALVLAGCAAPPPATDAPPGEGAQAPAFAAPDHDFSNAIAQTHNHADPSLHTGSFDMELVGWSDLAGGTPDTVPGGYLEVAVAGTWAFVANAGPNRGFTVVDVSDPARPRRVSDFSPGGAGTYWDVSVTEDATLVVLSAQASQTPLAGGPSASGGGLYLVNVEDKARPVLESFTPVLEPGILIPVGVHNANPFTVDGNLYVAANTANGNTHLFAVEGEAPKRTLREVAKVPGLHDTAVQVHPLLNRSLLYTAAGGVFIFDVTDPSAPERLAFLQDGPDLQSYHQTNPSNVLIDGRHYTVAATESAQGDPTPFTLIDTTDPTDPRVVGRWILPGNLQSPGTPYSFSGHNLDFDRGRLYIGHYHAGVWVVDASSAERVRSPVTLGFYQPHEQTVHVKKYLGSHDSPSVWNAILHEDGLIYCADVNTGLYVLRYTGPASPLANAAVYPTNVR